MDYRPRNLLDLDGTVLVLNEAGYWVKFEVKQVQQTAERSARHRLLSDAAWAG